jgi:hypothetical protein
MKKMTTLILLFAFFRCAAPQLSEALHRDLKEKVILMIRNNAIEAEFDRFTNDLRAKESPDWTTINSLGCMGWFQFAPATLAWLGYGYITPARFKKDPDIFPRELQVQVLKAFIHSNEIELTDYMGYIGKTINGTMITKSGILAGAHLGGAMAVKLYLSSGGIINNQDLFGTTIRDYIKKFQGYGI